MNFASALINQWGGPDLKKGQGTMFGSLYMKASHGCGNQLKPLCIITPSPPSLPPPWSPPPPPSGLLCFYGRQTLNLKPCSED